MCHQTESLIRTTWQLNRLNLFFYCSLSTVTDAEVPRWRQQTSATVSESCETYKCVPSTRCCLIAVILTRSSSQVVTICCRPKAATATGRVCPKRKTGTAFLLEHDVAYFKMGGITPVIDPPSIQHGWTIEEKSIETHKPRQRDFSARDFSFFEGWLSSVEFLLTLRYCLFFHGQWHRQPQLLNQGLGKMDCYSAAISWH